MKKIIISFIALLLCFGFSIYQSDSVQASMSTEENSNEKVPFEMRFYNDSAFENYLFISGDSIYISENHTTASPLPIDLITEPLTPGTYVITCDMVGLSSDEFLYEIGGNIYDKQNGISLPTTWSEVNNIITAKFTVTTPTNRLSLGEGGTYIRVNEAEWGHRRVMSVSLEKEKKSNDIVPFEMRFYNDSTFENNLFILGDSIYISENHTTASPLPIDLITEPLTPGTYVITCDMVGLSSDEFLYEIGGNIYDKQNGISLPTTWSEANNIITAKFTVTTPTNRLSLGEGGTYIRVNEAQWGHRRVMSVSLEKEN